MTTEELEKKIYQIFWDCKTSKSNRFCIGNLIAEFNQVENGLSYLVIADKQLIDIINEKLKIK